jgi:hypothetical protein
VFMRADRRPPERDLAALARALVDAERLIASAEAETLASRLPRTVVGAGEEFARRLGAARALYLPDGAVTVGQLRESIAVVRGHMPFSPGLRIPRAEEMLSPRRAR